MSITLDTAAAYFDWSSLTVVPVESGLSPEALALRDTARFLAANGGPLGAYLALRDKADAEELALRADRLDYEAGRREEFARLEDVRRRVEPACADECRSLAASHRREAAGMRSRAAELRRSFFRYEGDAKLLITPAE